MNRTTITFIVALVVVAVGGYAIGMQSGQKTASDGSAMSSSSSSAMMSSDGRMMQNLKITETKNLLIGTWSNVDDRNFNREYKTDGTVVDSHASIAGEAKTTDTWMVFTADNPPAVSFQLNNDDAYIEQTMKDGSKLYFRVAGLSTTELRLVTMDKGGVLTFGRLANNAMTDGSEDIIQKYSCDNGTVFFANLTVENEVSVWAEGTEPGVLPRVTSANGRKYSNGNWEYFFKGENATMTDIKTGKSSFCTPITAPGMAPVNVGN